MEHLPQGLGRALGAALLLTLGACASDGARASGSVVGRHVEVGSVTDTGGAEHDLAAALASGKRVALVFFQPWCGSCRAEAPDVVRAQRRYGDTMEVVGVVSGPDGSVDEEAVQAAILQWGITYPVVRDRDLALTETFGVSGVPTVVIVEPDGTVSYAAHAAPAEWTAGAE